MEERAIYRRDRKRRAIIIRRDDGLFQIREDSLSFDEESDVSYWSCPSAANPGIYQSAELAEREVRTWPRYGEQISD